MKNYLWTTKALEILAVSEHSHNPLKQRVRNPLNGLSRQEALRLGRRMTRDSQHKH